MAWVEQYWGPGAPAQVIEPAAVSDVDSLLLQVAEFGRIADKQALLEFWCLLRRLGGLASFDSSGCTFYHGLVDSILKTLLSEHETRKRILA